MIPFSISGLIHFSCRLALLTAMISGFLGALGATQRHYYESIYS